MARDPDAKYRRLAAIVFTGIVGYSAIVNREVAEYQVALRLMPHDADALNAIGRR